MTRTPTLLAASAALAALALAGCSDAGSTSGSTSATTSSAVTPTSAPTSPDAAASSLASGASSAASSAASGASSAASGAADQLQAARDCLAKAGLPTPTSTDATGLVTELPALFKDAKTRAALEQCGIKLPG